MKNTLLVAALLFLGGCIQPLRPGHGSLHTATGLVSEFKQSQNPQQQSSSKYERTTSPDGKTLSEKTEIVVGAAQKDTAREMAAKLSSLKGIVWVGVLVFLFGAASLFYPPLKLIVGSATTSLAACGAGVALIILPSLVVGHEVLILGAVAGGLGLWFFAHRHGHLRGTLDTLLHSAESAVGIKPKVGTADLPPKPVSGTLPSDT